MIVGTFGNWAGLLPLPDVNMRKPLSQQDQQKVRRTLKLLDNIYATQHGSIGTGHWEKEDEQVYLRKSDILTEGSIRMTFTLDSLKTKTVTDKFTFTDPQTGEDTPMTMELSPWGVSFTWKPSDPMPRVFGYVVPVSDKDILNGSCSGYVRTPDGLTGRWKRIRKTWTICSIAPDTCRMPMWTRLMMRDV